MLKKTMKTVQIDVDELTSLFHQGLKGNAGSFALLARRLISKLKKSDDIVAGELAELLAGDTVVRSAVQPVDIDSRKILLKESSSIILEYEPVWPKPIEMQLESVIREWQSAARLRQAGLEPMRALLFQGPPGVGKTLATQWLARELNLPLLTLDLATVMSSLLGRTGGNIKAVIDYAKSFPCILLLDEFDSIAKQRDDERDVGELKRLVTVLLQAIDEWPSTSILVAATNHPKLLDPAVWRRFDLQITFENPSHQAIKAFLLAEAIPKSQAVTIAALLQGMSFADLRRVILAARKKAILGDQNFVEVILANAISLAKDSGGVDLGKRNIRIAQLSNSGHSQRKIADLLGISHPTVGRVIKEMAGLDHA